jgi:hypothetical protein
VEGCCRHHNRCTLTALANAPIARRAVLCLQVQKSTGVREWSQQRSPSSMADVTFSQQAVDETKAWLEHVHAEQEKRPATELFACFNRDLTVCM